MPVAESQRVALLIDSGRLGDAERECRRQLAGSPDDGELLRLLAATLRRLDRPEEALAAAQAAVAAQPGSPRTLGELARARLATGDEVGAAAAARQAIESGPPDADSLAVLAEATMATDVRTCAGVCAALLAAAPRWHISFHLAGRLAMNTGNLGQAERLFRESLRLRPDVAADHHNLGVVLGRMGRHDEAQGHLADAARLSPQSSRTRQALAAQLRADTEAGRGVGDLPYSAGDVASTLDAVTHAQALVRVAHQALREGRPEDARAAAEQAAAAIAAAPPGDIAARRARIAVVDVTAIVRSRHGDPEGGLALLLPLLGEAESVLQPSVLRVFMSNVGVTALRCGRLELAQDVLARALAAAQASGNPDAIGLCLLNLGAAHAEACDDPAARELYAAARDLADRHGQTRRAVTSRLNLGRRALEAGDLATADRECAEAEARIDSATEATVRLQLESLRGAVALRRGDLAVARRHLCAAAGGLHRAGERRWVDPHAWLAEVAARCGRPTIAALHLQRASRRATTPAQRRTVDRARAEVLGAR